MANKTFPNAPCPISLSFGNSKSEIINSLVYGIIKESKGKPIVKMDEEIFGYMTEYRNWMFKNVYQGDEMEKMHRKASMIVNFLCEYYELHPEEMQKITVPGDLERSVCDFIAGMTDNYAIDMYNKLQGTKTIF